MATNTIRIKIKNDEHLLEIAKESVHILQNLLYAEEFWGEHFGVTARECRNDWREKAHDFLYRIDENNKPNHDAKLD